MMKLRDETMIANSMRMETIFPRTLACGSSSIRKMRSAVESRMESWRPFQSMQNSHQPTLPSPFTSYSVTSNGASSFKM